MYCFEIFLMKFLACYAFLHFTMVVFYAHATSHTVPQLRINPVDKRKHLKSYSTVSNPYLTQYTEPERKSKHTKRSKEPPVLPTGVPILKSLLNSLLSLLALRHLLESIVRDNTLQPFKLERVTGRHEVVVVDGLDEGLDLAALLHLLL